jgi:hypothetical protein
MIKVVCVQKIEMLLQNKIEGINRAKQSKATKKK